MLLEIQKQLMKNNLGLIDKSRTEGPGGFGGHGNNNDFFGGGGGGIY